MKISRGKLYRTLKLLLDECVSDVGLPQKPTIKTLYKIRKVLRDFEREMNEMPLPPEPPADRIEIEEEPKPIVTFSADIGYTTIIPKKQNNDNNL
jgi:hypothetical protein